MKLCESSHCSVRILVQAHHCWIGPRFALARDEDLHPQAQVSAPRSWPRGQCRNVDNACCACACADDYDAFCSSILRTHAQMDWDGSHNQWTLDEHCFKELDFVLAKAAESQRGVHIQNREAGS